jgi:hypothetical protein
VGKDRWAVGVFRVFGCVDPRFRVVDAPLDLPFALAWDGFQNKARHSEPDFAINQRSFVQHRADGELH